jgi:uncharacterized protein (TIRG00374 family)
VEETGAKRANLSRWLQRLIGPAVLAYLLAVTDLRGLWALLVTVRPGLLAIGVLLTSLVILFRAARWHLVNQACGIRLSLSKELHIYVASLALGLVTPGRAGEFARVHYLSRLGHASSRAMAAAVVDRLGDLAWMVAAGYLGLSFYVWEDGWSRLWLPASVVLIIACLFLILRRKTISSPQADNQERAGRLSKIKTWVIEIWSTMANLRISLIALLLLLTAAAWLVQYLQGMVFCRALGLGLSFWDLAVFISVAALMSVLPVSVAGIGTRDLALVYLFGKVGQAPAAAIAFSGLLLFNFVVTAACCALALLAKVDKDSQESAEHA